MVVNGRKVNVPIELIAARVGIGLLLRVLQPLNKLTHLVDEHHLALDAAVILLVPLENGLLADHVRLIKKHDDFLEGSHERHVRVTIFLDLEDETEFGARLLRERSEQAGVLFQVAHRLIGDELLLLGPLRYVHDRRPNDADGLVLLDLVLGGQLLHFGDDVTLGTVLGQRLGQHHLQLLLGQLQVLIVVQLQYLLQPVLLEGIPEIELRLLRVRNETDQVRFDVGPFDRRVQRIDALLLAPALEHVDEEVECEVVLDQVRVVQHEHRVERDARVRYPQRHHHRQFFPFGGVEILDEHQYLLDLVLKYLL